MSVLGVTFRFPYKDKQQITSLHFTHFVVIPGRILSLYRSRFVIPVVSTVRGSNIMTMDFMKAPEGVKTLIEKKRNAKSRSASTNFIFYQSENETLNFCFDKTFGNKVLIRIYCTGCS